MYRIINTSPKLTEAESSEIKAAAARAIYNALLQLIMEDKE